MQTPVSLRLVSLLVATSLASAGAAPRQVTPKTPPNYTSKPHGFALWLPVKPNRSKTVTRPAGGGETISMFLLGTPIKPVFYAVVAAGHPPSARRMNPTKQLDLMQNAMLQSLRGKRLSEQELQMGAFRGREVKMSFKNGAETMRMRVFTTPKIIYQLSARGPSAVMAKQSAQITKVFESLRILPK